MSWKVHLEDEDGNVPSVSNHQTGGVVAVDGSDIASCLITYNFSYFYYNEIDEDEGIKWLDGLFASETISVLKEAVETLGTNPHGDVNSYWVPCPGNAGRDLQRLLEWAREYPDATWVVR